MSFFVPFHHVHSRENWSSPELRHGMNHPVSTLPWGFWSNESFLRPKQLHRQLVVIVAENVLQLVLHPAGLGLAADGGPGLSLIHI